MEYSLPPSTEREAARQASHSKFTEDCSYPARAVSSPCFLFFRPLLAISLACQSGGAHRYIIQRKSRSAWTEAIQALQLSGVNECLTSKATLFKCSRPKEEVTNTSATKGWKHDPDVPSGHNGRVIHQCMSIDSCCIDYPTKALSSPCFLFFRPLIDASSGVRV